MRFYLLLCFAAVFQKLLPSQHITHSAYSYHTPFSISELNKKDAEGIISAMTLKEKVREICGKGISKTAMGMIFKGHALPVYSGGSKKHGLMKISFADGPRGVAVARATNFPVTMARGASWDRALERRIGRAMGAENRAAGTNYSGAVCINVLRHPAWGRAQETYGEDPFHIGELGAQLTIGIQEHNVMACVKHFALNSIENSRFLIDVNCDEQTLQEVYLPHFKKCIDAGSATVMSAYNKFRGDYCGHSRFLLTDVLRKKWGFEGFVSSDWFWGLRNTEKGIKAGMNIEMPNNKFYNTRKINRLIKSGHITEADLDILVFPIVSSKLEWQQRTDIQQYPKNLIACSAHVSLSREAAEKSAVLLKNENQLLPLHPKKAKRIVVVGALAKQGNDGDNASSRVKSRYVVSPLEGLKKRFVGSAVTYVKHSDKKKLSAACKSADAVVVIAGYNKSEEGEYIHLGGTRKKNRKDPFMTKMGIMSKGDRLSLELPERDLKLIETVSALNEHIVVCIASGSAVVMESWIDKVQAVMMNFYGGMEGGNALARLLAGDVNPSGKLPFVVPKNATDLPYFDAFADSITYGYEHGYTLFDKTQNPLRFPFGFGMSYTKFAYQNLTVLTPEVSAGNSIRASVEVINTGTINGEEVVQCYIGFQNSSQRRPVKLLRGFEKIFIPAGEQRVVEFEIPVDDIAYYDVSTASWIIEKMPYEVLIGPSSSKDELLSGIVVVK